MLFFVPFCVLFRRIEFSMVIHCVHTQLKYESKESLKTMLIFAESFHHDRMENGGNSIKKSVQFEVRTKEERKKKKKPYNNQLCPIQTIVEWLTQIFELNKLSRISYLNN